LSSFLSAVLLKIQTAGTKRNPHAKKLIAAVPSQLGENSGYRFFYRLKARPKSATEPVQIRFFV
jgi:hypothetical protein